MRKFKFSAIWAIEAVLAAAFILAPSGAHAASSDATITAETSVFEWSENDSFTEYTQESDTQPAAEFIAQPSAKILGQFGPFNVISASKAELVGSIETGTPRQFSAMLRAYPGIKQIDMIDCPGTGDDMANFAIARMIRKAGITTFIPNGGSVRSGGVELFLAGVRRIAEPGAEFAVHSWQDEDGLEADDIPANDPINLQYINYYREIGMDDQKARAFYAMTNSVPHSDVLYLTPRQIAAYLPLN
jgi:hypothetical protein